MRGIEERLVAEKARRYTLEMEEGWRWCVSVWCSTFSPSSGKARSDMVEGPSSHARRGPMHGMHDALALTCHDHLD